MIFIAITVLSGTKNSGLKCQIYVDYYKDKISKLFQVIGTNETFRIILLTQILAHLRPHFRPLELYHLSFDRIESS